MKALNWRVVMWQYALPVVILLGSLVGMGLIWSDPDIVWLFMVAPVLAFLIGVVFRPRRLWVVPTAVAILLATAIFTAAALDVVEPNASPVGLVLWSFLIGAAIIVLPQTFLILAGEALREAIDDFIRQHRGPQIPAT